MEAMTYDSLVTDIQAYAERDDADFVAQIPRFIMLAEHRLASGVQTLGYVRAVNGTLTASDPTLIKPTGWRATKSIGLALTTGTQYLKLRSYEYCKQYWPDSGEVGVPKFYADYDYEHFILAPTPSTALSFELMYYEKPTSLDSTNQVNWTTKYAPQLMLYACLLEAQPYLKLPERIQEFQTLYMAALTQVLAEDRARQSDSANERTI